MEVAGVEPASPELLVGLLRAQPLGNVTCRQVNGTPSQAMRFEQFSNVAQACIAGLGLALMPLFLIDSELANGQLVQAFPHQVKSTSAYYAVAPLSRKDFRPVVAFRAWLLDEVARYQEGGSADGGG